MRSTKTASPKVLFNESILDSGHFDEILAVLVAYGMIILPPSASCLRNGSGTLGAPAVIMIALKGAKVFPA